MRRTWSLWFATSWLIGCGDVKGMEMADARSADAAVNPCAPSQCLLLDDFSGTSLDTAVWGSVVHGGATATVSNGHLTLQLPAAIDAYADVYSLIGFGAGTSLEASVTFSPGQFYDHKAVGFSSGRIGNQCDVGETDAAMFRGQDGDGYIEAKAANAYSCNRTATMYPGATNKLQIAWSADRVEFRQNDVVLAPVVSNVPTGLLPIRFSAYTYTIAPTSPVQIDIDYVFVKR